MVYSGKLEEKQLALRLRSQGLSYGQIQKTVNVSKGILSVWCKDVELTQIQKNKLQNNKQLGQKKGSIIAAENKRKIRQESLIMARMKGTSEMGALSIRDKFIAGLSLYVAEGTKRDGHIAFSNADPNLILFMSDWFKVYLKCEPEKMRARIWIHDNLDHEKALQFWSEISRVPRSQFIKTYIVKNKTDSKKIRKNIHGFGVCTIYFSSTQKHRELMGWIYALFNAKMSNDQLFD